MFSPSRSHLVCCGVSNFASVSLRGHWNLPLSKRLYKSRNPSPSHSSPLILSLRLPQNKNNALLYGSRFSFADLQPRGKASFIRVRLWSVSNLYILLPDIPDFLLKYHSAYFTYYSNQYFSRNIRRQRYFYVVLLDNDIRFCFRNC